MRTLLGRDIDLVSMTMAPSATRRARVDKETPEETMTRKGMVGSALRVDGHKGSGRLGSARRRGSVVYLEYRGRPRSGDITFWVLRYGKKSI